MRCAYGVFVESIFNSIRASLVSVRHVCVLFPIAAVHAMTVPPYWKIKREIVRAANNISRGISYRVVEPIRKPIYDLILPRHQRLTLGARPLTDRVAIFVVFQPRGLAGTIHLTLDHLAKNDFSVVVVSNGPLRPQDRAVLSGKAAIVLQRPNVGYDFGGYRDGIRHLWSLGHDTSRLVLLNDSTWFPLRRDDDSLARMEALDADLAGHIFKTELEHDPLHDHVESHLLMFSRTFLRSRDFREFWSRYRMSNHRSTTITVGEKAVTQLARRGSWKIAALMDREWLLQTLASMGDAELRLVLHHALDDFSRRQPDASAIRRLERAGAPWRNDFLDWVDHALRNSRSFLLSSTFVMPALVYGGMGFIKKSADVRFHQARQKLLELEAAGRIPPLDDDVRTEIARSIRSWKPPSGQEAWVRVARESRATGG